MEGSTKVNLVLVPTQGFGFGFVFRRLVEAEAWRPFPWGERLRGGSPPAGCECLQEFPFLLHAMVGMHIFPDPARLFC